MHISYLFIFFTVKLGIGIGGSDGQLDCSFHSGFVLLRGDTVSNLYTVRFIAHHRADTVG